MNFDFSEAIKRATSETYDNVVCASDFIENNIMRFNMVLSKKKTEELRKNVKGICYALNNFGIEKKANIYNIGTIGAKENFESLQSDVQILRLHRLNMELSSAANPKSDMPIHMRCRIINKAFKKFTAEKKEKEMIEASVSLFELTMGKTDETKIKNVYVYALGK